MFFLLHQELEDYEELEDVLTPHELVEMLSSAHKPSYVSWRISTYLAGFIKNQRQASCPFYTKLEEPFSALELCQLEFGSTQMRAMVS